jgi:hypothetical protein
MQQLANFWFRHQGLARRVQKETVDGVAELFSLPVHPASPPLARENMNKWSTVCAKGGFKPQY